MPAEHIARDDPRAADVRALLARHLEFARAASPPESVFALDIDGLLDPAVTFFSFRADGELLGVVIAATSGSAWKPDRWPSSPRLGRCTGGLDFGRARRSAVTGIAVTARS
jgi:hypothetical protein